MSMLDDERLCKVIYTHIMSDSNRRECLERCKSCPCMSMRVMRCVRLEGEEWRTSN